MGGYVTEKQRQQLFSSNLRRRNSITTPVVLPAKLTVSPTKLRCSSTFPHSSETSTSSSPPSPLFFELKSFESSSSSSNSIIYTSLTDILPSTETLISPTAAATPNSGDDISIRHRLVKQAAWAYLQPASSSPSSSSRPPFLHHLWLRLSVLNPVSAFVGFINRRLIPSMTRAFDRILRLIRVNMTQ